MLVNVSASHGRDWFLSLKDHPERYRFATHDGIEFVQGDFGRVGARFKTREKFHFLGLRLKLELLFELVAVGETSFRFRLLRPAWLDIWGEFSLQELSSGAASLQLGIGSDAKLGQRWLKFGPVASAVSGQITQEVAHIKNSMESVA